ncbi:MAG: hypothetical protein V7785_25185 [Bermanella sp.]|jgi:hypothetical protein
MPTLFLSFVSSLLIISIFAYKIFHEAEKKSSGDLIHKIAFFNPQAIMNTILFTPITRLIHWFEQTKQKAFDKIKEIFSHLKGLYNARKWVFKHYAVRLTGFLILMLIGSAWFLYNLGWLDSSLLFLFSEAELININKEINKAKGFLELLSATAFATGFAGIIINVIIDYSHENNTRQNRLKHYRTLNAVLNHCFNGLLVEIRHEIPGITFADKVMTLEEAIAVRHFFFVLERKSQSTDFNFEYHNVLFDTWKVIINRDSRLIDSAIEVSSQIGPECLRTWVQLQQKTGVFIRGFITNGREFRLEDETSWAPLGVLREVLTVVIRILEMEAENKG